MILTRPIAALAGTFILIAFAAGTAAGYQVAGGGATDGSPATASQSTNSPLAVPSDLVAATSNPIEAVLGAEIANVVAIPPLALTVASPPPGWTFSSPTGSVVGVTEPGATVSANGVETVAAANGSWILPLTLELGESVATITATGTDGQVTTARFAVNYQPPAPKPVAAAVAPVSTDPKKDGDKDEDGDAWKADHEAVGDISFSASQKYGTCDEELSYDVFYGKAAPGATVSATSPYGSATTTANEYGKWKLHVEFPDAPVGTPFEVVITDGTSTETFTFTKTG